MNGLKKACILFLILVIALPGEAAHAVSFIPKFIHHYEHHNKEHHKVSLIEFIGEHFSSKAEHDRHEHHDSEHENCPLTHSHSAVQLVYIFKKDSFLIPSGSFVTTDKEKAQLPTYRFTFSEYNGSIWQPPKIA